MLKQQREQQLALERNQDADNRSPSSVPLLQVTGLYYIHIPFHFTLYAPNTMTMIIIIILIKHINIF